MMYVKTLTVIVCLKYKLWFGIWFESSNLKIKNSVFYWFNPHSKKVAKASFNTFTYHKTLTHVMYFKAKFNGCEITSVTRWNLPIHNPYNPGIQLMVPFNYLKFLVYQFSFIEPYTYYDLLEKIRHHYHANITHINRELLVTEICPTIIDFCIDVGEEGLQMVQNVLAIVYHFSLSRNETFQIHWIHHSLPDAMLQGASKFVMEQIFKAGHVPRGYSYTHTPCSEKYNGTEWISPRFMNILHSCLAAIFPSPSLFTACTERLQNIINLNQKCKEWISNAAIDKSHLEKNNLPYWLQNVVFSLELESGRAQI